VKRYVNCLDDRILWQLPIKNKIFYSKTCLIKKKITSTPLLLALADDERK
jgi:hypothetical protein